VNVVRLLAAWSLAILVFLLRSSCRVHAHGDPRPRLREDGERYVYAILHCHQVGAVVSCEPGTGAMVSRSKDGDLLVPLLRLQGIVPFRGSSARGGQDKGGAAALDGLIDHVLGGSPGYLAVDGPRGPRSFVHRGIAKLAAATGAAVIVAIPVPRRRWILRRTWDRFQIPKPFTRVDAFYGAPLRLTDGESGDDFCLRIGAALVALEKLHDPVEAGASTAVAT
jgi:lysophospholipid acyltransferase (LPLAT)-like uncharacterized protein